MKRAPLIGMLMLVFLTACTAASLSSGATAVPAFRPSMSSSLQGAAPSEIPTSIHTPTVLVFPTPIPENSVPSASPVPAAAAVTAPTQPTITPAPLPTAAPRLPAEKWQQWPVVPTITARAREIYAAGIQRGNNPRAFAKIGDCQCVNAAFFGIYDQPKAYSFPPGYEYLQQTVDWFAGSFNRSSAAVKGGFNVASVFVPLQADPAICKAGETPLACEFRITQPSIALISMETGFEGRTAAVYEKYMRQIIEFAIAQGALPILATKADNFEGDHSINLTTARLALEYDLPLWNFWRAVQTLPNHGMDPTRPDNFHISVEAWNVRSFTGLQALDSIWWAVK